MMTTAAPPQSDSANASRETLAQSTSGKGQKYVSPFRKGQGEETSQAIVAATLKFIAAGRFRPEAREIGRAAGCDPSAITRHFGSLDLLYRVIARERWMDVIEAAQISLPCPNQRHIAWLIMVGERKQP